MFLTKRPSGVFYIIYEQPNGKRTSTSTKTKRESEAYKILSRFKKDLYARQDLGVTPITIRQYEFDTSSKSILLKLIVHHHIFTPKMIALPSWKIIIKNTLILENIYKTCSN